MVEALDIWVKGIVQGVGFRPFVYRQAKRHLINGWVLNAVDGVHIHAEGESNLLDEFVLAVSDEAPSAARVTEIELHEVLLEGFDSFEIRFSDDASVSETTLVSPDLATCADCERELFDPENRRYRYPFINCTNCGPRFTIIDDLPYDRPSTSMRDFVMCDACASEYKDPADRRFHAQPDACFECGPELYLREFDEQAGEWSEQVAVEAGAQAVQTAALREASDAIFARAVELLMDGKILAVKGLGGFHLVCDANNEQALANLRARKHRDGKAFAVMMQSLDDVRGICAVSDAEAALLTGSVRPIVLLRKLPKVNLTVGLADKLPELGVMLPYTPVQHILLHDFAEAWRAANAKAAVPPMLVMTSGNLHDEPIVTDDAAAVREFAGIADAILGNNRAIVTRFDDSVVRVLDFGQAGEAVQVVRRARGYAPEPITLSDAVIGDSNKDSESPSPTIFATGPEQKNTFAFLRGHDAYVSQHAGDMESAATFDAWLETKAKFEHLFKLTPAVVACDTHPEYLTTKWAAEACEKLDAPLVQVQHHFAHVVSAMAESGALGPVCGIAFDGTGYGADGNIWGGEVLIANLSDYERFINFAYVPMPGGASAIKNPLRMAYGVLWEFDLLEHAGAAPALEALGEAAAAMCEQMIEAGINTPYTSSVGRLFDAASALLGICPQPTYEGEAAILLEASIYAEGEEAGGDAGVAQSGEGAGRAADEAYEIAIVKNTATETSTAHDTSVVLFDAAPAFEKMLDEFAAGVAVGVIARRFHNAFVNAIIQASELARAMYGIDQVVLTGGVFMNRYIMEHAVPALAAVGFTVILNRDLPPNDGCISFGQAVAAVHNIA